MDDAGSNPNKQQRVFSAAPSYKSVGTAAGLRHIASLQQQFEPISGQVAAFQDQVRVFAHSSAAALQQQFGRFAAHLDSKWRVQFDPTEILTSQRLAALIENGWYLPLDAPEHDLCAAADLFQSDPAKANAQMCEMVRDQIDWVERDAIRGFPDRAAILQEAFSAHRKKLALRLLLG
ncbi:MAG: hypothetical protein OXM54_10630 [Acidimicrobiaceae bacterium]|nr:hypothetical protein [Acidimicrobiaceae bacterium]